ncbi:MAG: hypothetical protein KC502_12625 [Myxococcales bacterium]|nr:hypothetical protein [Myxococcales bacterium]
MIAQRLPLTSLIALTCLAIVPLATPAHAADSQARVKKRHAPKTRHRARPTPKKRGVRGKKVKGKLITKFENGSPMWTLRQAFHCVLDFDESSGFDCYVPLNVEINRHNANARTHLRRYQWRHFRQYAASYVARSKGFAVRMTRRDPAQPNPKSNRVKIFLHSRHRDNPAPMTLKREGNKWLIYNNSL